MPSGRAILSCVTESDIEIMSVSIVRELRQVSPPRLVTAHRPLLRGFLGLPREQTTRSVSREYHE